MEENKNAKTEDKKEHLKEIAGGLSGGYKIDRDTEDASSLQIQEKVRAKERDLPKLNKTNEPPNPSDLLDLGNQPGFSHPLLDKLKQ